MRGLKHFLSLFMLLTRIVASFTDAWIETGAPAYITKYMVVASFTDAWIET